MPTLQPYARRNLRARRDLRESTLPLRVMGNPFCYRASSGRVLDKLSTATMMRGTAGHPSRTRGDATGVTSPSTFEPPLQVLQQKRRADAEHHPQKQPYTDVACGIRAH